MLGDPSAALLVAEVRRALEDGLASGFPQKVAANALGIAQRQLELGPTIAEAERARLATLVGKGHDLSEGNSKLCEEIRSGDRSLDDEALLDHLICTVLDTLSIDQPNYPAYKAWRENN